MEPQVSTWPPNLALCWISLININELAGTVRTNTWHIYNTHTYIYIYVVHEKRKCQLAVMLHASYHTVPRRDSLRAQQVKRAPPNLLPITSRSATCRPGDLLLQWNLDRRKQPGTAPIQGTKWKKNVQVQAAFICDAKHQCWRRRPGRLDGSQQGIDREACYSPSNERSRGSLEVPVLHTDAWAWRILAYLSR